MIWPAVVLALLLQDVRSQLTAQSSVAPDLRECYTDPYLLDRNNLPPTKISLLIDIIRKIEDNPNVNLDMRQISTLLLHTYRQDGIEYHQPDITLPSSANVLPYAPTFHSFHRHRLLVGRIIPNNMLSLPADILSASDKCALHHMLSTTVDARLRGDESVCNQLSRYRALRLPRNVHRRNNDDVEVFDKTLLESANKRGQMKQYNPNDDVEYADFAGSRSEKQVMGDSTCPLLTGVVDTMWGAVSAGSVVAGIAAASENQRIAVNDLSRTALVEYANLAVTSIYPATVSGDLAEASLIQGTERGSTQISVGVSGGWNSTQARKHYMLQNRINLEMTDPEIRGGTDGFVLGSTLNTVLSSFNSLKLSQILDMYYTARNGVFNTELRACNRRALGQQYLTAENLIQETYAFAAALDSNMPLRGTMTGGLQELITNAVSNFQTYANNMNDVNCENTETSVTDFRLTTNLYLVVDSSWQFQVLYPAVSYILDTIEVGKFGSSVTLLSASDGSVLTPKTFSLSDFHSNFTLSNYQTITQGVNLLNVFTNVNSIMKSELENEQRLNYVGGNADVLLFLLNTGSLQNNDQVLDQARKLNESVPDLRIIFATSINQFDNLWNLVRDMYSDIHTVSLSTSDLTVSTTLAPVINNIRNVGKRIVNSACVSQWNNGANSGTRQFIDYVEPGYTNFYSISPNYFYQKNDNRKLRISRSGAGLGNLVICYSRTPQPRQNASLSTTDSNAECKTLGTTGNVEVSLANLCDGYSFINACPFLHLSVQSTGVTGNTRNAICSENGCRFPYNIRYQVQTEEFGCYSSAHVIGANLLIILTGLSLITKWVY